MLIAESLVAVTYETDRKCRVETGQWWAPHLGHHLGNPSHLDVDHHVPLKNAHVSGGWSWDATKKEQYANYLEDDAHLIAISSRHNRSKGARGPEEWAPPDNMLWCEYATDWAEIKARWDLSMTPNESEIVMDMIGTCENPPAYEVEIRGTMEVRGGCLIPRRSLRGRRTGRARRQPPPGNRECREARAEERDSRSRWSRPRGTGMGMGWCVRNERRLSIRDRKGVASDSLPPLFRQHGDNKTRPNLRTENDVGTTPLRRIESPTQKARHTMSGKG